MRFLAATGFIVIAMILATAGFLHGTMCAGDAFCVTSGTAGVTIHKATP